MRPQDPDYELLPLTTNNQQNKHYNEHYNPTNAELKCDKRQVERA